MVIQYKQRNGKLKHLTPKECQLVEEVLYLSPTEQGGRQITLPIENRVYTLNEAEVGYAKMRLESIEEKGDKAATALLRRLQYVGNEVWTNENGNTMVYKDGSLYSEGFTFDSYLEVFEDADEHLENELASWAIEHDPNINSEALTDYLERSAADLVNMSIDGDFSWEEWDDVHVCKDSVLHLDFETQFQLKKIAEVYLALGGNTVRAAMFMAKGLEDLQQPSS